MFNLVSEQKLNARFFVQNITQVDTYFSIKHWFGMQRALNLYTGSSETKSPFSYQDSSSIRNSAQNREANDLAKAHSATCFAKFQTVCKLLKQWRVKQELCHLVYPEVLDSVLLMILN
jgi:hypothetical protein